MGQPSESRSCCHQTFQHFQPSSCLPCPGGLCDYLNVTWMFWTGCPSNSNGWIHLYTFSAKIKQIYPNFMFEFSCSTLPCLTPALPLLYSCFIPVLPINSTLRNALLRLKFLLNLPWSLLLQLPLCRLSWLKNHHYLLNLLLDHPLYRQLT